MPHFDIIKNTEPSQSFRVKSVMGSYDLQCSNIEERFVGNIDLPENWNIGLIVGRSGSGKSTIAKELFGDYIVTNYDYSHDNILDDMPQGVSVKDICITLSSVGFSSPPSWLKPYSVLSNGEKMRCDLARAILEQRDIIAFDEFTSVVDRNIAQLGSFALQKVIRRNNKKFIAITCHYDVQQWLMPDWVFNTDDMTFHIYDVETQKKNRPTIKLNVYKVAKSTTKEKLWRIFGKYHYLNHNFNKAATVYVCEINNHLCGFCAVLPFPHPIKKNCFKGHRTVVIPDYQGIGIGKSFTNMIAELYASNGKKFISTTSNPAMIFARKNDSNWVTTRIGRLSKGSENGKIQNKHKKMSTSANRITVSFEYVGDGKV